MHRDAGEYPARQEVAHAPAALVRRERERAVNAPRQPAIRLPGGGGARPPRKSSGIGFGIFFGALGLLFAYFSWSQFNDHWTLRANGERVQGVIVGYDTVRGRRSTTYYPVLRYNTRDGATVQASATGMTVRQKASTRLRIWIGLVRAIMDVSSGRRAISPRGGIPKTGCWRAWA